MCEPKYEQQINGLIKFFWMNGFLTITRKHGKYLPAPKPIANYEIEAMARARGKFVIGIVLNENDLTNKPALLNKIIILSTRTTKSRKAVKLYIGIPSALLAPLNKIIKEISNEIKTNIKICLLDVKVSKKAEVRFVV